MFRTIGDALKMIAGAAAGIVFASLCWFLFYEGLSLPLIGSVIGGNVASRIDAAKAGLVSAFEYQALLAQRDQETRLRTAAEQAATEAKKRAAAAQLAKEAADARVAQLAAQAKAEGLGGWSEEERRWLERN